MAPVLLVTGAAGLLGSELCARAARAGWIVQGIVHRADARVGLVTHRVDVRDAEAVLAAVRAAAPEVVIHTAYRQDDDATTRDGAAHVARAAAAVGARLVHLSSDVVFSGTRPGRPAEDDEPDPLSAYGRAKAEAEVAVAAALDDVLLVRTSLLYRWPGPPADPQARLALDPSVRLFDDEVRRPAEVGELADALLRLAPRGGPTGLLHLVGAQALDRLAFARLLAAAHGRDPAAVRGGPGPPGRPKALDLDDRRARAFGIRLRGAREVLTGA